MIHFDDQYRIKLTEAWDCFIKYQDYDYSFLRPEIFESWKRSRDYRVDPMTVKTAILNEKETRERSEANRLLIETVRPYMENLYSIVEGSGFYLMLTDRDGYILDLLGDEDIIREGKKNSLLVIGANRSESFAGTNAIGTSISLKRAIQIWNGEHYVAGHKKYTCSAAPIFNSQGNVIGCMNLTGQYDKIHTHTLGMVMSAVDGITKELKIRNAYEEIETIGEQRNLILESVSSGLILLDGEDKIVQINGNALRMLGLHTNNILGKRIFDLISFDEPVPNHNLFSAEEHEYNKETTVYFVGTPLPPVKFNMSVSFIESGAGRGENKRKSTVIRLEEATQINRLVNKIGGFKASYTFDSIVGSSLSTRKMIETCKKAAVGSSNVLILGESGTGKELVAQSIHNSSHFAQGPFVAINCGALPKGLIESELFGYEKGAFTGANKEGNPGKFELADGGTIFLDEIGDMPLDVQVTLLRLLQNKEVVRIGGKYPKKINVRIIAATNRNLEEAIAEKTFREDLYYRLNVMAIPVPPLRERGNDVCELADHFVRTFQNPRKSLLHLSEPVYDALRRYAWPGNIRELENAMERAINVAEGSEIRVEHLPRNILEDANDTSWIGSAGTEASLSPAGNNAELNLKNSGYQLILSSLESTGGNIKESAKLLGISRRTLYRKMDKYGIPYQDYRD